MTYNLRSRTIHDDMLAEDNDESYLCSSSDNERDEDLSYTSKENEEFDENEDVEMENATSNKRILESRARGRPRTKLRGKNNFVWDTRYSNRRSERFSDASPALIPSPAGDASNANNIDEFWSCLFNEKMIDIIVKYTNKKIEDICALLVAENRAESYHHHTDGIEIKAYIAVLYFTGLWKSSNVSDDRLWDKKNGITLYRCIFPKQRFTFLSTCLPFDDKSRRDLNDRLAPIRKFWDIFINNCKENYTAGSTCTVDEQLLSFRGHCKFRVYIKDKPGKYGLKLISLNDAQTSYMIYAIPYLGKNSAIIPQEEAVPEYYFRKVTEPIYNSNRSVTCDNWYTSIPLLQRMLKEPYNMRINGTIEKNKREIPIEMKVAPKKRPATKFCHTQDLTLLSYAPKKNNKVVLVVSSFMHTEEITEEKPIIVRHYNTTKGGTDNFDKLCHNYTVSRRTTRWPVRFFYRILDQSIVNARILFKCKLKNSGIDQKARGIDCLDNLYMFLVKPYLQQRYTTLTLRRDIRVGIGAILGIHSSSERALERVQFGSQLRCSLCPRKLDKKCRKGCAACHRPVCEKHIYVLCINCCDQNE